MGKPQMVNRVGARFGRLTVLKHEGVRAGHRYWRCKCDCGEMRIVESGNLTSGNTQSCGCWQKEVTGNANSTHGYTRGKGSTTYAVWCSMLARCNNPNTKAFKDYGGRGVTVCRRWLKFENFLVDMGEKPEGLTLDRKNNNKNYSKRNCRWVTRKDQNRNRRSNIHLTHKGKTKLLVEWAELLGFSRSALYHRYDRGWPVDRILTQPQRGIEYAKFNEG